VPREDRDHGGPRQRIGGLCKTGRHLRPGFGELPAARGQGLQRLADFRNIGPGQLFRMTSKMPAAPKPLDGVKNHRKRSGMPPADQAIRHGQERFRNPIATGRKPAGNGPSAGLTVPIRPERKRALTLNDQ
jgi:hypothetical protein